jgi:opacity protein-like surface antigen
MPEYQPTSPRKYQPDDNSTNCGVGFSYGTQVWGTSAAFAATAHAADMPVGWPEPYEQAQPFTELMSGWYLRGDVGYRFNKVDGVESLVPTTNQKYPDSVGVTAGAGFKYHWFRTDVTVDFGPPVRMRADSAFAQPQYSTRIDAVSVLANAYFDLGTWAGFTPYVGAGVGASYLRAKDYADAALPGGASIVNTSTNFSWAWMAGVAFQVKPNWVIDVGYRHLDLGDVATTTGTTLAFDRTVWKSLTTDEVRVGFRLLLD